MPAPTRPAVIDISQCMMLAMIFDADGRVHLVEAPVIKTMPPFSNSLHAASTEYVDRRHNVVDVFSVDGVAAFNLANGDFFTLTLHEDVELEFSDVPNGAMIQVQITQDAAMNRAVIWPASFRWPGGIAVAVSTGLAAVDLLTLTTFDGGTTWLADLKKDFS